MSERRHLKPTAREWAAFVALTLFLALGVTLTWEGERPEITVVRMADSPVERQSDGRLDINVVSVEELTALHGIGPTKAAAIVAYRAEHGRFPTLDSLVRVRGIGPRTLELIREHIKVER